MPEHRFTENDQIKVDLQTPAGATAVIIRARVQKGPEPPAGETIRLFYLRLAKEGKVRETQILELIYRDGSYTAGFSGFGGGKKAMDNPENRLKLLPIHMGPFPRAEFGVTLTVPLNSGKNAAVGLDGGKVAESPTEITPGSQPLVLLLGFQGEGDLRAPVGWTISWENNAVEWVGASSPGTPPSPPSPPVVVTPPTPSTPPAPPSGLDWKAELRKELEQLAWKYAVQAEPQILLGLQLLLALVKR